jgi:hypothetical protein
VVGVQDEAHVEDARLALRRHLAAEHVEEVRGDVQLGLRLDGLLTFPDALDGGDENRELRRQPDRSADGGLARDVVRVRRVEGEGGDGRGEHVHHLGVFGEGANKVDDLPGQLVALAYLAPQLVQLVAPREPPVPEQEDGLLEGRMLGQIVDVVALIDQDALLAVHVADGRAGGHHAAQARPGRARRRPAAAAAPVLLPGRGGRALLTVAHSTRSSYCLR